MEDKLLHRDLSYALRGLLFEIHNELGQFRNEKQYGDAYENKLQRDKYYYEREVILPPTFTGEHTHRNRIDFVVEHLIIVEFKHVPAVSRDDYLQCQRYLVSLNLDLALLVNFRTRYLTVKRVLNHEKFRREQELINSSQSTSHKQLASENLDYPDIGIKL